ncbi:cell surface protein SprA [Balneolales bacterium ANBcel1]|nr:cell surface protein SprA [Balneolales bacterium ANBcel1]
MLVVTVRNGLAGLVVGFCLLLLPFSAVSQSNDTIPDSGIHQEEGLQAGDDAEIGLTEAERRLFSAPESPRITNPFPRKRSPLIQIDLPEDRVDISRDSLGYYTAERTIFGVRSGYARRMDFESFSELSLKHRQHQNWRRLVDERRRQTVRRRGLLDFTLDLPVGERSAFTTIFGRPEVNLSVTGTADMSIGASISDTDDPSLPPDQQRRIDPTFEQNLRLNIQGMIGDKLTIATDWDTQRAFDYENRMSIRYQGYEDEILQSVELGNVSMETGNTLIRGGGSLFGVKAEAKFGPLRLTSVVSQQEGQSNTQTIEGGSQTATIEIRPAAYDNDRHFFIDFFAWQEFENAMADPVVVQRMFNINRMDVYVLNTSSREQSGQRRAAALVDLGVVQQGGSGPYLPPDQTRDRFDEALLEQYRDPNTTPSASDFGVSSDEFVEGYFVPLQEGVDYTFDENTGYLSLESRLDPDQALAVSFSHSVGGTSIRIGDLNTGDDRRMFLKLLRPSNLTTSSKAWDLTMRNVYSLNATNLRRDDIEIDIVFDGGNTPQTNLPGLGNVLLQDLGLDRVNASGEPRPDNQIDFGTGTLDAMRGRIIFPYLQPFGSRIAQLYEDSGLSQDQIQENIDRYTFPELYTSTQNNARRESGNNLFKISGSSRGSVQDSYNLGIAIVEGSVSVRANGVELTEGVDYEVDYSIGNIMITNRQYLQAGQEIVIDYESNQVLQIQQTTFAGLRAEYTVNDNISFGSTYFSLKERPLQDKIPIGDEPINNSVLGFDGKADFDAPWLTRAINWLPLIQTRADSEISFSGEFAQLRPDVAQTRAVSRAIDRGDLYPDEERGLSFIDDFEGSKTSINFLSPGRWNIAAAPHAIPGYDGTMDGYDESIESRVARSDMRGKFSWYMIPINIGRVTDAARTPESLPVSVSDVFPNREVRRQEDRLQTLDIHYNPRKRGPYNYNENLRDLLENRPEDTWGGMTAAFPSGLDNLRQNNIEFLEFWVQPLLPDGRNPTGMDYDNYDGKIYIDLGLVSEDVIPNNRLNTEDGLARAQDLGNLQVDNAMRSYIISRNAHLTGQFSTETQEREDVGLDGAHSTQGEFSEQVLFSNWLELMAEQYADQPEILDQILNDPSNDKYYYFNDPQIGHKPLHERFHRMYGFLEGNSLSRGDSRSITNRPDTEGLINPASVNRDDSFFQFEIPFNPGDPSSMRIGENYIVDMVDGDQPTDRWYLVRLPLRDVARQVGSIEDLERVQHIRFWMAGYHEPMTMRFATFELVGNQWRELERLSQEGYPGTIFEVSTINIEENSNRQPIPYRIPNGAIRSVQRGQQEQVLANEQSLSMRVEDLRSGEYRMLQRFYPNQLNLLNYSNLRMFVHGEGYDRRSDVEVVIRLGNDLSNNYYEYRQPVSPTDPNFNFTPLNMDPESSVLANETDRIWIPDSNSVNIVLSSLNALKQARNLEEVSLEELYERTDLVQDAPPGAVIAVVGNPSLGGVREIGIGIRNPHDNGSSQNGTVTSNVGRPSLDAELWVNELRVSGFEDQKGWGANFRTTIRLADLATVRASFSRQTDGFGHLNQSMIERQMFDMYSYDLNTQVNLHRFLPERYGWNIPLQLSARRSQQTPRFLPQQGDVRFSDFEDAVDASDLTEEERELEIDRMLDQIRTQSQRYGFGLTNISKSNSESTLLRYTVDNINLSYVYNLDERSDPNLEFRDQWDHRTSLNYRLNIRNVNVVRPLTFLDGIPVLQWFSTTGFTYVPSQVNLESVMTRRYSEELRRGGAGDNFSMQQQHSFNFESRVSVNYNLTQSISTSFSNTTELNLQQLGQREVDPADTLSSEFRTIPTLTALESWFFDPAANPRRDRYQESYSASWRPRLTRIEGLDWLNYSASFRGSFRWTNSAEGSGRGAAVQNQFSFEQNPELRTQNLLERVSLYRDAKSASERERRERNQARSRDDQDSEWTRSDDMRYFGRRMVLGLLSIQSINVSYTRGGGSGQGGYAGDSQIYYMFGDTGDSNFSPPFGYRIGLRQEIPRDQLIRVREPGEAYPFTASVDESHNLNVRTGMRPFSDLSVNLNWSARWDDTVERRQTLFYGDSLSVELRESGNITTSVWAFGGGYESLFELQVDRALDAIELRDEDGFVEADKVPLIAASLEKDFRKAYFGFSDRTIGVRGFLPLPLPNWDISWSGWENRMPLIQRYLQRATINHRYTGQYNQGWQLNSNRGDELPRAIDAYTFLYHQPDYDSRSISLQRNFAPLVGLQMRWVNNMNTQINYNTNKQTSISLSNNTVTERNVKRLSLTFGYSKRGFRIPFFRQLNNQIDINLTTEYSDEITYTYRLNDDVTEALRAPEGAVRDVRPARPDEQGSTQLQIRPSVRYQFSQTITAGLEYSFVKLMPRSSQILPRTDQDIRFNIQVRIRSN